MSEINERERELGSDSSHLCPEKPGPWSSRTVRASRWSTIRSGLRPSASSTFPSPRVSHLRLSLHPPPKLTGLSSSVAGLGAAAGAASGVARNQPAIPTAFQASVKTGIFAFTFFSQYYSPCRRATLLR